MRPPMPLGVAQFTAVLAAVSFLAACRTIATTLPSTPGDQARAAASGSSVDASTLDRKLIFGYQGWFGCPADGSPRSAWEHWFRGGRAGGAQVRVDMWPDVSELDPDERCETG